MGIITDCNGEFIAADKSKNNIVICYCDGDILKFKDRISFCGYIKEANQLANATMAGISHWYMREGCTFETYDPQNILCPSELGRKGPAIKPFEFAARLMSVRDFGWSACLYVAMAMERENRQ